MAWCQGARSVQKRRGSFNAFTGVETVSAFERHGKKTAWSTWLTMPEIGETFAKLSEPTHLSLDQEDLSNLEIFVIKMYSKTLESKRLYNARKALIFEKGFNAQQLPPTSAALKQHALRAFYQAGHVWGNTLVAMQNLPGPCGFGWRKRDDGSMTPFWTHLLPATKDKISKNCGCKNNHCSASCGCKTADMNCNIYVLAKHNVLINNYCMYSCVTTALKILVPVPQ